ncbi:DUF2752 domain-containing protein [Novipirellula aureliae]|uniref:DUF2752 domain-containing protein n=1 Tax=Novipirellula aureliae TaxID=2527966 RepID=UPI0011B5EA3D|nr:DUF2752 domain-containing protein [Novipirellula aureliae]
MKNETTQSRQFGKRFAAIAVGFVPLSLLITAGRLNPSPLGLGTHQQLGLPPCTSRVLFGVRCPSCGMTTSWSLFMHGKWMESISVNAGGFLLAIVSCVIVLFAVVCLFKPSIRIMNFQKPAAIVAIGVTAVTLVDWGMRTLF